MSFKPTKYRAHNGYDQKAASDEATIPTEQIGLSLTVQAHAEDADINVLMRRYGVTGKFPDNPRIPHYGDFAEVTDFRSAMEAALAAQQMFDEYPASFRAQFGNDPQKFMDFCTDPANKPLMGQMGLLKDAPPPPTDQPTRAAAGPPKIAPPTQPQPEAPPPANAAGTT